ILRVEESLWTFARVQGVPPTNNAAERAERHAVIWRRISGGTDSARGSRFVERMLSMVATCRQQGRNVLDYLRSCFEAARGGHAIPSLLPVTQPKIKVA
ncbi:MAG: IS66 family transposase, partial [Isosphaeraceae bacterium]